MRPAQAIPLFGMLLLGAAVVAAGPAPADVPPDAGAPAAAAAGAAPSAAPEVVRARAAPEVVRARAAVAAFAATLQGELKNAIAAGGPVNGIKVCAERAPAIAHEVGTTHGLAIGRTSLKTRNPANTPDAWERAAMSRFEQDRQAGADPATLEAVVHTAIEGRPVTRYMKAIVTQPLCTTCHGATLAPEVEAALRDFYPADAARGFAPGDLRGAFTVTLDR